MERTIQREAEGEVFPGSSGRRAGGVGESVWAAAEGAKAAQAAPTMTAMSSREADPGPLMVPGALREIVEHKRAEVAARKSAIPFAELEAQVAAADPPRNFFSSVTRRAAAAGVAVIAEIKRKSPSAGLIRPEYEGASFRPERIAQAYCENGAAALSCLTDERFFGGELGFIERARDACPLPVLRKDFIIDPWQLWESRAAGADAVLLIAECLTESLLVDLLILSQQLQMTVLLEAHSMEHLLRVRPHVGFPHPKYCLLGINNRDLSTMRTDLGHTLRLIDLVDDVSVVVSESGIATGADLRRLGSAGVRMALVGEHLMRQEDPGLALGALLRDARAPGTGGR